MLEDAYGFELTVHKFADVIAPDEGHHHQQQELRTPPQVSEMRVLYVEPRALYSPEHRLNLPSTPIGARTLLQLVVRDEDLQFRLAVAPLDPTGRQVAGLPVDIVYSREERPMADRQPLEHPVCFRTVAFTGIVNPEVVPDADVVSYALVVEPLHPVLSDKLMVGEKAVDALCAEEPDIAVHKLYPLPRVGGALLGQHAEQHLVRHPVVHHGEHEDVDVGVAELPVGPVDG